MTTTTADKSPVTLISAATSNAAGASTRGAVDLRTAIGGLLTVKLTNGGTGPTLQATAYVMAAHDSGSLPATGALGTTWKTIATLGGGGTTASAVTEFAYRVPLGVMHLQVEVSGNTGQAVTCEAFLSKASSVTTV